MFLKPQPACSVYKLEPNANSSAVALTIEKTLSHGGYRKSSEQNETLATAYTVLDMSSELREAIKGCNLPSNEIDARRFAELSDLLRKHMIFFGSP